MNMRIFHSIDEDVRWMAMSPWWLAKSAFDTFRFNQNEIPELNQLGQNLVDVYDLGIPPIVLKRWMQEFSFIN